VLKEHVGFLAGQHHGAIGDSGRHFDATGHGHEQRDRQAATHDGAPAEGSLGVRKHLALRDGAAPVVHEVRIAARNVGFDRADASRRAVSRVDPHPQGAPLVDEREQAALNRFERLEDLAVARTVNGARPQNRYRDVVLGREDDFLRGQFASPVRGDGSFLF
jgi:hypothetical protein